MKTPLPSQVVDLRRLSINVFACLFSDQYGFPRAKEYFLLLVECAREYLSIEAICNKKRLSPDRLLFYMKRVSVDEAIAFTTVAMKSSLDLLKKHGKRTGRRGFLVAIDMTDLEYFGQEDEYRHNSVKRKGTRYQRQSVHRYATLSVVAARFKLTLAIIPVARTDKTEQVVDRLLCMVEKLVRIRCVVLDKGFYNTAVLDTIEKHGLYYLLPVVQKEDITQLYWQCTLTGIWKWPYTMNRTDKKRCKQVVVRFHELYVSEYIGFITNMEMKTNNVKRLIKLYDRRWNIENGYKEAEDFMIRTSSKNHAYRLLLYTISHLMVNLQNIVRETRYRVRYYEMHEIIDLLLDPITEKGEHEITKRLTVIL